MCHDNKIVLMLSFNFVFIFQVMFYSFLVQILIFIIIFKYLKFVIVSFLLQFCHALLNHFNNKF